MEDILKEFVDWLEYCGEDAFYVFDSREEAIERFLKERGESSKN